MKRDPILRAQIRQACQAVLDAKTASSESEGIREDEEYQRILELRQLLPR